MTTNLKPVRIVTATVKSKAEETWHTTDGEAHEGFSVGLDIPEFRGKFPTICDRVPPELATQLKVGNTYRLRLEQQSIKKDRTGKIKAGNFLYDYYWGLLGVATEAESKASPSPATRPSPEAPGSPPEAPSSWNQAQEARGASIEAQVAAYCTAQVVAAQISVGGGRVVASGVQELIAAFFQGMQEAKAGKHTGGAAPTTGEVDSNLSPDSPAKPTTRPSVHPDSEAGPGAALPIKPDISIGAFWKGWKEAKLPTTNKGVEELISQATGGKALQVQQAQDIGWRLDELLAKVLEVKEKP